MMAVASVAFAEEKSSRLQLDVALGLASESTAIFIDHDHDLKGSTPSELQGRLELRAGARVVDREHFDLVMQAPLEIGLGSDIPIGVIPGFELGLGRRVDVSPFLRFGVGAGFVKAARLSAGLRFRINDRWRALLALQHVGYAATAELISATTSLFGGVGLSL